MKKTFLSNIILSRTRSLGFLYGILSSIGQVSTHAQESLLELEPYTVRGTLQQVMPTDLPVSISVVNAFELEGVGSLSISEGLEEVVGLVIQNESGRVKAPSIRGTPLKHSLVLFNGKRMAPGFRSMVDLNQFLQGGMERVEVLRGPVSALYGSDSIGGVVNMMTQRAVSTESTGSIRTLGCFGDWETMSASANFQQLAGNTGVAGAYGYRHVNSWESGDGAPSDVDEVATFSALGTVEYRSSSSGILRLEAYGTQMERIGMRPTGGGSERTAVDDRIGVSLEYEHTWKDERAGLSARVYGDFYQADISFDLPANQAAKFTVDLDSEIRVADLRYHTQLNEVCTVLLGAEVRETEYDLAGAAAESNSVTSRAIFAQTEFASTRGFLAVVGGRLDSDDGYGEHLSPRITASWSFDENWTLSSGVSTGFRAPNVTELYLETFQNGGKTTLTPNRNLDPESSLSYEVGLHYANGRFSASAVFFQTDVEDMIEAVTLSKQGNRTTQQWQNLSEVEIAGFELEAVWKMNPFLDLKTMTTWLDPKEVVTGNPIEGQHEWVSKFVMVAKVPEWGLQARTLLSYVGKTWGAAVSVDFDAYTRLDVKLSKQIGSSLELELGAKNILNEEEGYQRPVSYFIGCDWHF